MNKTIVTLLIILFTLLLSGCSEKEQNTKTVAFISLSNVDDNTFNGFKIKMKELGWSEDDNIEFIIAGAAKSVDKLPEKVTNILKKTPDLVLVSSTPATIEVKKQIKEIPVVFCPVNDPIAAGIVKNSNQPEANITGVRLPVGDFKRAEWLYQIAPNIKKVFVPFTPNDKSSSSSRDDIRLIANEIGFKIIEKPLVDSKNIEQFIANIPEGIDAIILPRDSIIESAVEKFVAYSLEKKLPLSVPSYQQVKKGALYTFGFIHKELGKDAAMIADKVLKGIKVNDLPVKFGKAYLVVNETTAKKIGIELSGDVLNNAKLIIK